MQSLKKSWLVVSNGMWSLVNFHPTTQKSENFTSMGYFCPYYRRFELKNTEELSSMRLDSDAKFDLVVSKMAWGIGWTFIRALKSLKNCVLMGSFSPKHMFQLEHFRGIMSWHGRVRQDLKENWLVACKRIWLIFMSTVESLKICTFMGSFCSEHNKVLEKKVQKICLITLKSDAKFEEKLALGSKNDEEFGEF